MVFTGFNPVGEPKDCILVALDVPTVGEALDLVEQLREHVGGFKIGLELITSTFAQLASPGLSIREATSLLVELRMLCEQVQGKLFYDGKWDDIPNTVGGAAKGVQLLSPIYVNVHVSAGLAAIKAAVAARGDSKVLGVTVLTSISNDESLSIFGDYAAPKVLQFAQMLIECGADGIVCSPQELPLLKERGLLEKLEAVIPGIRPLWAQPGDQARTMTPAEAVRAGATRLVIGRPITKPPAEIGSPVEAAKRIAQEIADGG